MNLADLQKEAHAIAKDHGWWDQERTFGDLIALVHSELSEALEAYRAPAWRGDLGWRWVPILDDETAEIIGNKPVGVASELADVVIRVADMAEFYGVDLATLVKAIEHSGEVNGPRRWYVTTGSGTPNRGGPREPHLGHLAR